MEIWEQVLLGMGAFIILFLFWPGAKLAMQRSRDAENRDWQGMLIPIGLVVVFVIFIILVASNT